MNAQILYMSLSSRDFWASTGRDPSVLKSNWLYVDIYLFLFINMRCMLCIFLNRSVIFLKS